ncbi:hypothetical protein SASPL_133615 [Salvia splendens]|uniref:NB-ARC domain-containing protein n=1 Tax=Salvia splendens TaxID=180675 RepID=A0A8X8ZJA4_SALSN|nr:hypothetical protein SASPL_133615 [Salvia splendens]
MSPSCKQFFQIFQRRQAVWNTESETSHTNQKTSSKSYGIGKTTLAKYTYEDGLMKTHFDVRGWVRVSQHYNFDQIVSSLRASRIVECQHRNG